MPEIEETLEKRIDMQLAGIPSVTLAPDWIRRSIKEGIQQALKEWLSSKRDGISQNPAGETGVKGIEVLLIGELLKDVGSFTLQKKRGLWKCRGCGMEFSFKPTVGQHSLRKHTLPHTSDEPCLSMEFDEY